MIKIILLLLVAMATADQNLNSMINKVSLVLVSRNFRFPVKCQNMMEKADLRILKVLTLVLWVKFSADDILKVFSLFFPEDRF